MRKSICFTALAAILLVMLSALMLSLVSCKEEPAEKFSVNFIVEGTEYASIATAGEERISIPASPSKEYYTFGGWYRDKDVWNDKFTADSLVDERLTDDLSVYARFIPAVEYKATFKAGDTVVAEIPFTIDTESITPPAVPTRTGYTGAWESFTLGMENITVNAVYTIVPYTITYNNVNGATNSNPATYTVDQAVTLIDAYKSDEAFAGWYSEPEFNNRITEIPRGTTGEIALYAKWVYAIEISTAEQLKNISLNERYILTCDIDLGGAEWTPIGTWNSPFTGSLDGDGYKITNFKITTGMQCVGLFGRSSGTLLNLGVEDFEIDVTRFGAVYAGGLVGYNDEGEITNCYATGAVSATSSGSGSSYYYGYSYAGGLVGYNNNGTITNCYATGDVSATSSYSYSDSYAGGLVGYNNNNGRITNCYRYSGQSFTVDKNGTVSNSATNTIGTEKTMEELLSVSFQTDTLGWSADKWTFTEGEHPVLKNVGLTE